MRHEEKPTITRILSWLSLSLLACIGTPTLEIVYEWFPAERRPVYVDDPRRQITWVSVDERARAIIGCGPGDHTCTDYEGYARIGFADGGWIGVPRVSISWTRGSLTVSSPREPSWVFAAED